MGSEIVSSPATEELQTQALMTSEITSSPETEEPQAPGLMTNKITSSPAIEELQIQTEPKRLLMPNNLLKAAIGNNVTDLNQLLGLNNEQPPLHTNVTVEDGAPTVLSQSDCLRSVTGMKNTILHILSANGHQNLVSTICEKDSTLLKARNVRKETPFHHAARFGHINTISELIRCAKSAFSEDGLKELLRQKNCLGETALHKAARYGHGAVVSALMEEDLELAGLVNNNYVSPLYLATARGSLDTIKNMVKKLIGQDITPAFYSGPKHQTALHAAVLQKPELTKELLQLYSEPLGKGDETGRTPLHFIASTGNHYMAKLLLDKDPSLAYMQDSDGSFPVHTAVRMGHAKVISLLLEMCLDSDELLDCNGRNFLHIAIEGNKSNVFFNLLKYSNKLTTSHWKKMFDRMVNTMDDNGNTPLHLAAEHGYIDVMFSILKNNELDLALQNKEGLTAFDISVIQLQKSARNTKSRDVLGEFYVRNGGARFSTGWFQYYTKEQMPKTESISKDQIPEIELIGGNIQDHILTSDTRGAKERSENVMTKAQLVGLGSVLIATVTFAAAFTLPGGTDQVTGTPILGRKYIFKAFVLADFSAFFLSFLSTMVLIYSSGTENSDTMERNIAKSMNIFTLAAKCMVMALALGLHLVLAPIGKTGTVVIVFSTFLVLVDDPLSTLNLKGFHLEILLLQHIPYRASGLIRAAKEIFYFIYRIFVPTFAPLIIVFVFALI